ncbi:MAG: hypothetical protein KatS3mg005_2036 [Bryobacteraceae bacterium]|nr:MAG: hypothetical protein KatS3mg005_2036 [Bryobacteraceae bacterium]
MFRLFRPTYTVHGDTRQSRVFWAEFTMMNGVKLRESLKTRTWETAWKVAQAREEALLLEQARNAQKSPQTRRRPRDGSKPSPAPADPSTAILDQLQPILAQALAQAISGLLAGQLPQAGGKTLRQACNDFLRTLKATRDKSTFMTARSALKRVLEILGRDRPAESITQAEVIRLIERLKAEKLSARTINLAVSHLARALGGTVRSLWPSIRKLKENTDAGRALSDQEIRRLLEEADRLAAGQEKLILSDSRRGEWTQTAGPRGVLLPCFLRLLLFTGMRSGEAKTLQWRHVDFQKGLISVPGTKTDAARRVIPMHPDLQRVLETHKAWCEERFGEIRPEWFVFPAGSPAPNNPRKPVSDFKHGWETIRERSGVQCRMHDLRHTFISRLAESGVPEVTLMELAGHVSRSMMLRYSHPRIEARREAVQAIKL